MSATQTLDARTRVLDAAELIASRDGARRLTLDSAAREAGVSKGGVLYHFPTKLALLEGMLERALGNVLQVLDEQRKKAEGKSNPTLRAIVRTGREMLCAKLDVRITLLTSHSESPVSLEPVRAAFASLWVDVQRECPDAAAAFAIWSAIEGLQFFEMFKVSPLDDGQREQVFERLERMIDALPANEVIR